MPLCPRCGESLIISRPHGPSTWVERCPGCGQEGGGTVSIPPPDIADDNGAEFTIDVVDPGPNRSRLFHLYRETLGLSPAEAKKLLALPRVAIAHGPRMGTWQLVQRFQSTGATLDFVRDPDL